MGRIINPAIRRRSAWRGADRNTQRIVIMNLDNPPMSMLYLVMGIKNQFRIANQSVNKCDRAIRSVSRRDGDAPRRY